MSSQPDDVEVDCSDTQTDGLSERPATEEPMGNGALPPVDTLPAAVGEPTGSIPSGGESQESRLQLLEEWLRRLEQQNQCVLEQLAEVLGRTGAVAQAQQLAAEQTRRLGAKVEQLAAGAGNAQLRHFAEGAILLYDLVVGIAETPQTAPRASVSEICRMLAGQLLQLLQSADIEQFGGSGAPDYQIHRAVETVTAESGDQVGQIVAVSRLGFRMGGRLLRPADVVVAVEKAPSGETVPPAMAAENSESDPLQTDEGSAP